MLLDISETWDRRGEGVSERIDTIIHIWVNFKAPNEEEESLILAGLSFVIVLFFSRLICIRYLPVWHVYSSSVIHENSDFV